MSDDKGNSRGMSLDDIGLSCGTDKASRGHNYLQYYDRYLRCSDEPYKIMEIGVQGGNSMRLWETAFPNAQVLGIDIDPECMKHQSERVAIEIADQTNLGQMRELCKKYGPFDVIIDDGSHRSSDMRLTFCHLIWRDIALKPGGLYVVEDLDCCYERFWGGGLKDGRSFVEFLKNHIIDELSAHMWGGTNPFKVSEVCFFPGIVFVRKKWG